MALQVRDNRKNIDKTADNQLSLGCDDEVDDAVAADAVAKEVDEDDDDDEEDDEECGAGRSEPTSTFSVLRAARIFSAAAAASFSCATLHGSLWVGQCAT